MRTSMALGVGVFVQSVFVGGFCELFVGLMGWLHQVQPVATSAATANVHQVVWLTLQTVSYEGQVVP